jgi:hypothetical protein
MSIRSAATAVGFVDRPDWPRMRLLDFWPMRKGKLLGFARVELPISLRIRDIPILAGPKGVFAALSPKPIPDGVGRQKRDVNGRPKYLPFWEWRDRGVRAKRQFIARSKTSTCPSGASARVAARPPKDVGRLSVDVRMEMSRTSFGDPPP